MSRFRKESREIPMKWIVFLFMLIPYMMSQASAGLEGDLVLYLTFDNVKDNRILDASGNKLHAEVVANTILVKGRYGDAIHIAAEPKGDDCVHIRDADALKIENEITMMAWVYNKDWNTNSGQWFDKGSQVLEIEKKSYGMGLFNDTGPFKGPNISMLLGGIQGVWSFTTSGPMVDKRWHHIAGTYDGKTAKIYLDGKIRSKVDAVFEFSGTNDLDLRIGCAKAHPQYTFKNGSIDQIGLWRRALTQAEIEKAMKSFLAVSPKDKISTTWGDMKRRMGAN
ncbi:hypothetical protein C6500_19025 [Candidatus Poribacteria bacterium]|nr:MAG: hypothetical protein C6500_19025 [Candidatus Poribacteria bacterium]